MASACTSGTVTMFLRIAGEDDPLIQLPLSPDREAAPP